MKKLFVLISCAGIFLSGLVLQSSYEISGHAPWSMLVSSVGSSAWELTKPYLLVFIMWSFIELSCLRPHLLHYLSSRIISMHFFICLSCSAMLLSERLCAAEPGMLIEIFLCILAAETLQAFLYRSRVRTELFFVPLMISFAALFFSILFCSFYPPPFIIFLSA